MSVAALALHFIQQAIGILHLFGDRAQDNRHQLKSKHARKIRSPARKRARMPLGIGGDGDHRSAHRPEPA